jgi:hypothetical protein
LEIFYYQCENNKIFYRLLRTDVRYKIWKDHDYGVYDKKKLLGLIDHIIENNQEELAMNLYNRFVKKEK